MDSLEGTPEFNRNFRLLNQAGLDPYHDQPIPNQQPLNTPRDEMYQHYIEEVVEPEQLQFELQGEYIDEEWLDELDEYSKQYHPFQEIVPDNRTGFDSDGNWHAVESFTLDGLSQAITPFRWRDYLEDAIQQYASTCDYELGAGERFDLAESIVRERMEALDSNLEKLQLEKALELWKESYGRGYRYRDGN